MTPSDIRVLREPTPAPPIAALETGVGVRDDGVTNVQARVHLAPADSYGHYYASIEIPNNDATPGRKGREFSGTELRRIARLLDYAGAELDQREGRVGA